MLSELFAEPIAIAWFQTTTYERKQRALKNLMAWLANESIYDDMLINRKGFTLPNNNPLLIRLFRKQS